MGGILISLAPRILFIFFLVTVAVTLLATDPGEALPEHENTITVSIWGGMDKDGDGEILDDIWRLIESLPSLIIGEIFHYIAVLIDWCFGLVNSFFNTITSWINAMVNHVLGPTAGNAIGASGAVIYVAIMAGATWLVIRIYRLILDLIPVA